MKLRDYLISDLYVDPGVVLIMPGVVPWCCGLQPTCVL
jgi:hypothetical protein